MKLLKFQNTLNFYEVLLKKFFFVQHHKTYSFYTITTFLQTLQKSLVMYKTNRKTIYILFIK